MDIRALTPAFAVSPQITPEDIPAIAAAGFRTILCNRPDEEIPPPMHAEAVRAAAETAGIAFVCVPLASRDMTPADVRANRDAIAGAEGPVLAYCASGTRSTVAWMFGNAGSQPADELVAAAERAGYPLGNLRDQLDHIGALVRKAS
ncbi:TIGR01244 family sulfur transferase [Tropicimonas aquimaris]|uniref:TIGR01244 family sulfur transferase n=1 Tax=Tropicimonas aquimaris TaxID=914152 RepID=A0ABW3IN71_9RHOB